MRILKYHHYLNFTFQYIFKFQGRIFFEYFGVNAQVGNTWYCFKEAICLNIFYDYLQKKKRERKETTSGYIHSHFF